MGEIDQRDSGQQREADEAEREAAAGAEEFLVHPAVGLAQAERAGQHHQHERGGEKAGGDDDNTGYEQEHAAHPLNVSIERPD